MTLWVLFLVLIAPVTGFPTENYLNKFDTSGECVSEMLRIGADMAASYPGDKDYRIECHEKIKKEEAPVVKEEEKAPIPEVKTPDAVTKAVYDEIIKNFAKNRFPKQKLSIKVTDFKPLQSESGILPVVAIQIHITHSEGVHSYIIIIKNKTLLGWIDAGEVDPQEEEAEMEEEYPAKDQA